MPTATSHTQNSSTNGHEKSNSTLNDAIDAAREAGTVAQKNIVIAADRTEKMVKARPLAAIGLALGGGFILGAVLTKVFSHQMTIGEQIEDRLGLKRRVARAVQRWL